MHTLNLFLGVLVAIQTLQDAETFVVAVMSCQPSGGFGKDDDQQDHRDQENALQDGGYTPDEAGRDTLRNGLEGVVDPVDYHDTKVQGRELHADV